MKLSYLFISSVVALGSFTSCSDVLDVAPDGTLSMEEVYADPDKVGALLNACYNSIPQKGYVYYFFDPLITACSDDGWSSEEVQGTAIQGAYSGNASASGHPIRDMHDGHGSSNNAYWSRYWQQIRLCNQFLENIDNAAVHSENLLAELNYKRFMFKKLCIFLIFSKLKVAKLLIDQYRMHNLYAIFAKLLNICKQIAGNLVNESGNVPRRGVVPKFSDLEVVALNMASEAVGIDSESLLFAKLQEYRVEIPNLISRRQYNDRRKITSSLCHAIREKMVSEMDGDEDYFCIDSKPIEVCRIARSKRCSMGKKDYKKAPGVGYCASQSMYYYGYKLHAVCGLSGVIHSFDLTKASVHDIHYLKDVKVDYSNCTVIGDRGYISAQVQLDLFETANIRLEVPYRCNQKEWKPTFPAFAKARKRIETLFSQLCDQFMIIRNYAKDTDGLFARIIGKISALTILQYINYKNEKPIGRVKYALF